MSSVPENVWWQLDGFVQMLFEKVNFASFMRMRLVCRRWRKVSYDNQSHWYDWLTWYGKSDGIVFENHNYTRHCAAYSKDGDACVNANHYEIVKRKPVIRKMIPLYIQCFNTTLRKRIKEDRSFIKHTQDRIINLKDLLAQSYEALNLANARLQTAEDDLDEIQPGKRRRIDISNLLSDKQDE